MPSMRFLASPPTFSAGTAQTAIGAALWANATLLVVGSITIRFIAWRVVEPNVTLLGMIPTLEVGFNSANV